MGALGFEVMNEEQWQMRTFDLHERIGAMTDEGAVVNGMVAPAGYQFRSLRQNSVWGEQPNPEETERMMLQSDENVYMTAAGYITRLDDPLSKLEKDGDK